MANLTSANDSQTTSPITPIDPSMLISKGESTTSILLAISILLSMMVSSITGLVRVILMSKPPK